MTTPFDEIAGLNKIVHEPARLAILTALSSCKKADFLFLRRLTGLTKGNLSAHLTKLEQSQLVDIEKTFVGKKPATFVSLSQEGRREIEAHWKRLENLRNGARHWSPSEGAEE
ncbi:MAG TPA: transcriptional regulator [Acidobacteriota bacterium]|nr:transcriptional regulator [Acidobacteriota bacterium]